MKKLFKTLLVTASVIGLVFALNALVPSKAQAASSLLSSQAKKELKDSDTLTIGLEGTYLCTLFLPQKRQVNWL